MTPQEAYERERDFILDAIQHNLVNLSLALTAYKQLENPHTGKVSLTLERRPFEQVGVIPTSIQFKSLETNE